MRTALELNVVPHHEMTTAQPDIDALASALDGEARLLVDLAETLRRQRTGVANDDVELVDESVYGSWRVMRTLEEARRRRSALTVRVFGSDIAPSDWDAELGATMPPALCPARDRLLVTAEAVARDIAINQRVLQRAIQNGEQAVRTLFGAPAETAPCYGASSAAPVAAPGSASLINRQV